MSELQELLDLSGMTARREVDRIELLREGSPMYSAGTAQEACVWLAGYLSGLLARPLAGPDGGIT